MEVVLEPRKHALFWLPEQRDSMTGLRREWGEAIVARRRTIAVVLWGRCKIAPGEALWVPICVLLKVAGSWERWHGHLTDASHECIDKGGARFGEVHPSHGNLQSPVGRGWLHGSNLLMARYWHRGQQVMSLFEILRRR